MQIDFHHGATWVAARCAGMSAHDAGVVAYAAQYVDDATNSGVLEFDDGASYSRISSAHKMLDYRNFAKLAAARVWVPFHFLPGNDGLPRGQRPAGGLNAQLVCRPDSAPARDMVRAAIASRKKLWGLHRLGITMHVFADTWAHQGFAGVQAPVNEASDLRHGDGEELTSLMERLKSYFVVSTLPLGHGAVLSYPDRPWLHWSYTNGLGERIERDNPTDFGVAVERMCQVMRQYVAGNGKDPQPGLDPADAAVVARLIAFAEEDAEVRLEHWRAAVAEGAFSFGVDELPLYVGKGTGSWKHRALGTKEAVDRGDEVFSYSPGFLRSDWKRFHDALQEHRFDILHRILPRYDICVA